MNNSSKEAAEDSFGSLSYRELDGRSSTIAKRLQGLGVSTGDSIGVYVPYVKDVIVGALSTWKSGGVYMPMDDAYPAEKILFLDEISETEESFTCNAEIKPDSPAMLLYKSGTTGYPKGVLHRHEFLTHIVDWMNISNDLRTYRQHRE